MNPSAHNSPTRFPGNLPRVEIESIPAAVSAARVAHARWASTPLATRLAMVRELRHLIAENTDAMVTKLDRFALEEATSLGQRKNLGGERFQRGPMAGEGGGFG